MKQAVLTFRRYRAQALQCLGFTLLLALAPALHADTYHDALNPALPGGITGLVIPPDEKSPLQTVVAVEPFEARAYQANVEENGRFTFRGLPPGEYDLIIKVVGKAYEALTLEREDETVMEPQAFKPIFDAASKLFFSTEDYFNHKTIVRMTGNNDVVRFLAVQTRDLPVVEPSGEPLRANIRRFDLVEMVRTRDIWQIRKARHLLRQEVPYHTPDIKLECIHVPKLGGILVGRTMRDLGRIELAKAPRGPEGVYPTASWTRP